MLLFSPSRLSGMSGRFTSSVQLIHSGTINSFWTQRPGSHKGRPRASFFSDFPSAVVAFAMIIPREKGFHAAPNYVFGVLHHNFCNRRACTTASKLPKVFWKKAIRHVLRLQPEPDTCRPQVLSRGQPPGMRVEVTYTEPPTRTATKPMRDLCKRQQSRKDW